MGFELEVGKLYYFGKESDKHNKNYIGLLAGQSSCRGLRDSIDTLFSKEEITFNVPFMVLEKRNKGIGDIIFCCYHLIQFNEGDNVLMGWMSLFNDEDFDGVKHYHVFAADGI